MNNFILQVMLDAFLYTLDKLDLSIAQREKAMRFFEERVALKLLMPKGGQHE